MGGKNKQRTKGNVRPSSSGRAAELLARESGVVPGFVGFGTTATTELGYVPAVHGAEEIDNLVDGDFRLVLRKLSKRDTVTKLKAAQEFGSMCQEREADVVKGVLPYWPRIYCKISVDHDRRVREATQLALEQLVLKVRRSLAPFLKSLMGHWLLAQCDTYPPAASAARQAFHAAFPPSKQPEALSFCRDEVLNVLQDNLLKETADTLSDPQYVPEEEREAKFLRLITSSLLGVKRLLSLLPRADREALEASLTTLTTQPKFWKYSKHKNSQVRGAFFEVVSALCEHAPRLVQEESARVCPAVLLSVDDTDPVVLPPLLEGVLHVLSTVTDCWQQVNARKGVLPKLWAVLREGGRGMATALHPNLLPLISKLPPEVTEPPLDFYTVFFTSLIQGLSSERAVSSPSEKAAVVSSTLECLRYCLLQNSGGLQHHTLIQNMLISEQLLPLVDSALGSPSLQSGPLFSLVTDMLVSWEKRAGIAGGGGPYEDEATFHRLLADFWEGLGALCALRVDSEDADPKALEGVASLLQVMQSPATGTRKQSRKKAVRICLSEPEGKQEVAEEEEVEVEEEGHRGGEVAGKRAQPEVPELGRDPAASPLRSGHLEDLVCRLAELTMAHVREGGSGRHLLFLSLLLRSFSTPRVFTVLLGPEDGGERERVEQGVVRNPAVRFLLERVVLWLEQEEQTESSFLVEMVFSSLRCCSHQETTRILNHITTMDLDWSILLQIIQKACIDHTTLQACGDWLKGSVLGERLLGLAEELCKAGIKGSEPAPAKHTNSWALISLVLSQNHSNGCLIGEVYVEGILEKLHATLSEAQGLSQAGDMEPLVSFICEVASTFFSSLEDCLLLGSAEELLLTVFQLTAQDQAHTHLSDSSVVKLKKAFVAGLHSLLHRCGSEVREGSFLQSSALWVKSQLLISSLGVKSLQVLVLAVQSIVETIISDCRPESAVLTQFLSFLTPSQSEWSRIRKALPPQWVKTPLLRGRLQVLCDYPSVEVWRSRGPARLPAHLCVCALLGKVLHSAAVTPDHQQGAGFSSHLPDLKHTAAELLYAVQWCKQMEEGPGMTADYLSVEADCGLLQDHLLPPGGDLLEALYTRSLEQGGLWSLTLQDYIKKTTNMAATSADTLAVRKLYGSPESWFPLSESSLSTLQALYPILQSEDRLTLLNLATSGILNWQEDERVCVCLAVLLCCLRGQTPVEEGVLNAVLASMMEWRNTREHWFLFNSDLSKVSAAQLTLSVEMMRFLSWLVTHSPTILGASQWDFLLCSMLAWLETVSENVSSLWNPWVQLFVCENTELMVKLHQFFIAPPAGVADLLPSELTGEWNDFFMDGICSLLLPLPVKITEAFPAPDDPLFPLAALRSVGVALTSVPVRQLSQNSLAPRFVAGQRTRLPEQLQTLLNTFCPLLLLRTRPLQIAVYHMLDKVMPQLPECDGEGETSRTEDDQEEPCLSPPAALMSVLSTSEQLCESVLGGVAVGESALVPPLSAEHCCILGYLLAWKLLLTFFRSSPSQLRVQYSLYLKERRCLHKLLLHLLSLMPESPALPGQGAETVAKETKTFFTESLSLDVDKCEGVESELPHLACSVYYSALQDVPAMVRLWWTSQEKRVSTAVEKFTSRYVSPVLSSQEICSVHASTKTFDSMTVKARSAAREVIATYSVDDIYIELVIQLPQNYPLGAITVESGRRVGVAVQQWRNWMLQLSTYLTHQNGSIMEGLALWKNNVDKRFDGVEDCMICFSVIHGSNYSLPKKACRTCKKKFHSACLYKWFTSSNKSTCPLCRETFF